jgi:LysM repeat protein
MNKVFIVLFTIMFTTTFSIASPNVNLQQLPENKLSNTTTEQKAYVEKYKDVAMRAMKTYDVLASVSLAQGILESGAGTSELVSTNKNHFAISCDSKLKTTSDCYKNYEKDEDSFMEHAKLIKEDKAYKRLFSHAKTNYIKWAYGLRKYGYATDKNYPKRLLFYIEKYKLYQYDDMVLSKRLRRGAKKEKYRKLTPAEKAKKKADEVEKQQLLDSVSNQEKQQVAEKITVESEPNTTKVLPEVEEELTSTPTETAKDVVVEEVDTVLDDKENTEEEAESFEMTNSSTTNEQMPEAVEADDTVVINNTFESQYYTVEKGDTYYNISNRFGLTVPYLKQLNNATSNLIFIGQQLKISGEASEYRLHDIVKGDTLYNISNRYGVTINYLKLLNNVGENNIIYIGHVLKY